MYDVTREDTLISVRKWIQSVREGANDDVPFMILSNKHDQFESLEDRRKQLMKKSFQELVKVINKIQNVFPFSFDGCYAVFLSDRFRICVISHASSFLRGNF